MARGLLVLWLAPVAAVVAADPLAMTEAQVKALCVLNFAKYVDWPADALAGTNSPFTIGYVGDGKVADSLKAAAQGKTVGGRQIVVIEAEDTNAWKKCEVLLIPNLEKRREDRILKQIGQMPILTIGESDSFLSHGGIINLMKSDGKVRFEVNLPAAEAARLQISSKLLNLADHVERSP